MVIVPKISKDNKNKYIICEENGIYDEMKMDIDVIYLNGGENYKIKSKEKETAVLLVEGNIKISWEGQEKTIERKSSFDDLPSLLHVAKGVEIKIESLDKSEIIIQQATNKNKFESKFYSTKDCVDSIFDDKALGGTNRRIVRDIINYGNAPYSNLVIGEVINFPGKWSSYPSHSHDQPEVYYYKFTKPQGFGAAFVGNDVQKITHKTASIIPGGLVHPQVAAPGYGMYYVWMIRHLEKNPWTTRDDEEAHKWLRDENAVIWPNK